ncbi:unnamed protein product [Ixodes pacificus]
METLRHCHIHTCSFCCRTWLDSKYFQEAIIRLYLDRYEIFETLDTSSDSKSNVGVKIIDKSGANISDLTRYALVNLLSNEAATVHFRFNSPHHISTRAFILASFVPDIYYDHTRKLSR